MDKKGLGKTAATELESAGDKLRRAKSYFDKLGDKDSSQKTAELERETKKLSEEVREKCDPQKGG